MEATTECPTHGAERVKDCHHCELLMLVSKPEPEAAPELEREDDLEPLEPDEDEPR